MYYEIKIRSVLAKNVSTYDKMHELIDIKQVIYDYDSMKPPGRTPEAYEEVAAAFIACSIWGVMKVRLDRKYWEDIVLEGFNMLREILDRKSQSYEPYRSNLAGMWEEREGELISKGIVTWEEVDSWHEMGH